ncbi:MAG TPA: hypothetical protein VKM72_15990 [Thermoanaerobaculia bacterium]|nr:hypothetical protein [Thermoanaerobaculia bacterium]
MEVTVGRTLFLLDKVLKVTIITWEGEEVALPVSHLVSFVDHIRSSGVTLPPCPAAVEAAHTDPGDL